MLTKYLILMTSALCFALFGLDKWLAKKGRSRISETVLLLFTFIGGTIGSLIGMAYFKHKTAKKSFVIKLLVVIALQITLFLVLKEHLTQ